MLWQLAELKDTLAEADKEGQRNRKFLIILKSESDKIKKQLERKR